MKYLCVFFSPARCITILFFPINPMTPSPFSGSCSMQQEAEEKFRWSFEQPWDFSRLNHNVHKELLNTYICITEVSSLKGSQSYFFLFMERSQQKINTVNISKISLSQIFTRQDTIDLDDQRTFRQTLVRIICLFILISFDIFR